MALICPACGTENRSVAKFCIECICALPTEFEATRLSAPPQDPHEGMPPALAAFAAGAAPSTPMTVAWDTPGLATVAAPPARKSIWIGGAMTGMLLMGALGWFAAGGTLWHAASEAPATPIAVAAPAEPMVASTPVEPIVAAEPAASPPPLPESPKSVHRETAAERLFARCDGLGFIAASRCKVDQCTKGANRRRTECQPVLAQLQLMEEKRNPTQAN